MWNGVHFSPEFLFSIILVNEFKCGNSTKCIPRGWVCDNDIDCKDGSDESDAQCASKHC